MQQQKFIRRRWDSNPQVLLRTHLSRVLISPMICSSKFILKSFFYVSISQLSIYSVGVRFELTIPKTEIPVFKTGRINHSRTPPTISILSQFNLKIKLKRSKIGKQATDRSARHALALVAQRTERWIADPKVRGSIPPEGDFCGIL